MGPTEYDARQAKLDKLSLTTRKARLQAASSHLDNESYLETFHAALLESIPQLENSSSRTGPEGEERGPGIKAVHTPSAQKERETRGYTSSYAPSVLDGWLTGPICDTGTSIDLGERPILCSAAKWDSNQVVLGSSDHALYVVDTEEETVTRQLYNKNNGHSEWVTCVSYLPDGSIVSGGMDNQICLWAEGNTIAKSLKGHTASVSKLACDGESPMFASASYDKSVRIWNTKGKCKAIMEGHSAPVMELEVGGNCSLLSGDRSGNARLWDAQQPSCLWELSRVHKGHITALAFADASGGNSEWAGCFATGGQDGRLRLWDPRAHSNPHTSKLHSTETSSGAISSIIVGGAAASFMAATAGADKTVRILDCRSVKEVACISLSDYPYSFSAAGGLLLAGCGDGSLHVIDILTACLQYTIVRCNNAVRTIEACRHTLTFAGDDGQAFVFKFQ